MIIFILTNRCVLNLINIVSSCDLVSSSSLLLWWSKNVTVFFFYILYSFLLLCILFSLKCSVTYRLTLIRLYKFAKDQTENINQTESYIIRSGVKKSQHQYNFTRSNGFVRHTAVPRSPIFVHNFLILLAYHVISKPDVQHCIWLDLRNPHKRVCQFAIKLVLALVHTNNIKKGWNEFSTQRPDFWFD